ncbi:MAG: hypothetical protein K0R21_673 [Anaerocolumna sp.]|jgi:hypothetical protein|nr:hypothetical protein [Anaerocolumna sp.]
MKVSAAYEKSGLMEQMPENNAWQDYNRMSGVDNKVAATSETAPIKSSIFKQDDMKVDPDQITYNKQEATGDYVKQQESDITSEEEQLENNGDRLTKEDYESITKEGISLEQYNIERLDRALTRIKSQRTVKSESLEQQVEELEVHREAVLNMAGGTGINRKIIERLEKADMPVTDANIARIAGAVKMTNAAIQMTDKAMSYMIKNQLEPTIQNVYKAQHSGSYSPAINVSEETWNSIQGQANDIITEAGLENNNENITIAKWLFQNQLPLTEDNIYAVQDLNTVKEELNLDLVMDKAVKALSLGKPAETANLSSGNSNAERIKKNIEAFHLISDEAIDIAVKGKSSELRTEINLKELLKAQSEVTKSKINTDQLSENGSFTSETASSNLEQSALTEENSVDIASITVRRQLEEIRLKMTLEAGGQLNQRGLLLDTDSLSKIVEGLKELEDQYYRNLLQEGDVSINQDSIDFLKGSLEGAEQLKSMPAYILGSTLESRKIQTVGSLLEAGQGMKQSFESARTAYETLMTSPRSDMGDSIAKAFRNVDDILTSMDLETTAANERAVRILGYNQMEITEENIQNIKTYDQQVNDLFKNLQPAVTVTLIKNGINPINIPIDELNLQIQEIKDQLGVSKEEKYSKFLWKLEKEHGITEDEKKSYIGIYRLLNAVEKTHGAALGAVIKADQEINLNNLLTAVRTVKSGGVNADIDDSFGSLKEFTVNEPSITSQIQQGYHGAATERNETIDNKFEYMNHLLRDIMDEITPQKLTDMGDIAKVLTMSAEKLYENMEQLPDNMTLEQEYWIQQTKEFQELTKDSGDALNLLKTFHLPNSIQNIQAAKDMLSTDQTIFKQWKKVMGKDNNILADNSNAQFQPLEDITSVTDQLIDAFNNPDTIAGTYQDIKDQVSKVQDSLYNSDIINPQEIWDLKRFNNGMALIQKLASRENYTIPIPVGDEITQVNVTILRNTEESGKVRMSVKSENLGQVNIELSVKENVMKGLILADNRTGLDYLKSAREDIISAVNEIGFEVNQMNYGIDKKQNLSFSYSNHDTDETAEAETQTDTVSTQTLYNLARTLLIQIKNIETRSTYEN